jgi:Uma2 family endonuclease
MPSPVPMTEEEYLALERLEEGRSEFRDGLVVPIEAASFHHEVITANVVGLLWQRLRGRHCTVCPSHLRVFVPSTRLYTYPDALVVCGEPRFRDGHSDTLLNPTLLIEVHSPSSATYDRGKKLAQYRTIEGLAEVLLVAQDRPRMEQHTRDGDRWHHGVAAGLEACLLLPSVGCELALREVYDKVDFG